MKKFLPVLRGLFFVLSLVCMVAFMTALPFGSFLNKLMAGLGSGILLFVLFLSIERFFQKLKTLNTIIVGLLVGGLFGYALSTISTTLLSIAQFDLVLQPQTFHLVEACAFLLGTYLGTVITIQFSEEIAFSIPFIKLTPIHSKKKDLLIDLSALSDSRILDLAGTGLVDHTLLIPRFLLNELYTQANSTDETISLKAKKCLETFKKLEALPQLAMRYEDTILTEQKTLFDKLLHLARMVDANILTADMSQAQIPPVEGVKIINLHSLSNALKPLMQAGEMLKIKVQRLGKEPNQGVGYLEDGTMVVVNGGGDYLQETIEAQVLSVKHTSSGRMIFCNAVDEAALRGPA